LQDFRNIAPELHLDARGLWIPAVPGAAVSYPDDGNAVCAELEASSFWFAHRNACLLAVLDRLPPGGALFDIGAGNGFAARALVEGGQEVVVVEPGVTGALNAQARGLRHVVCATFAEARFKDGALPAAGLFDVLEHIEDAAAFLTDLVRALVVGGRLYLTVPAHAWLWSQHDAVAGHFRRYTFRSLCAALASAGLAIEYATPFFAPLVLPVLFLRAIPHRLGHRPSPSVESYRSAHAGPLTRVLERALLWERARIAAGGTLPFGASLLAVARKS